MKTGKIKLTELPEDFIASGAKPSFFKLGFSFRQVMNMDLKEPLPFEKLAERMEEHHVIIPDKAEAVRFLRKTGYYRLTGYLLQYRVSENNSDLQPVSFHDLLAIYNFDSEIRNFLRKYIEIAEIYYRTQISHWFSLMRCSEPPHDQHYDERDFYLKKSYREVMQKYNRDKKEYYGDTLVMQHHQQQYGGREPLWVITEILSFSNLSKLYKSMHDEEQIKIAKEVGARNDVLANHLHCITILRNKCAHAARLYNTKMAKPAKLPKRFLKSYPDIKNNSLFAYMVMLLKRMPDEETKEDFIREFTDIAERNKTAVDLRLIGMPENYKKVLTANK